MFYWLKLVYMFIFKYFIVERDGIKIFGLDGLGFIIGLRIGLLFFELYGGRMNILINLRFI